MNVLLVMFVFAGVVMAGGVSGQERVLVTVGREQMDYVCFSLCIL